jgi:hypothetical protein
MLGKRQKQRLHNWWTQHASDEVDAMLKKLDEYGAGDLYEIGYQIAKVAQREVTREQAYELGVMFYAVGKMQRIISAAEQSREASTDTWHDLAVYSKMVLANRAEVMP